MARPGDGIYERGKKRGSKTWWLDFMHRGERHVVRIGKGISRTVAASSPVARAGVEGARD